MNTENKMKKIVIIAGVVIIFLLAAPYLYKVLLYGVGWVIWGFMAYFIGGVPFRCGDGRRDHTFVPFL